MQAKKTANMLKFHADFLREVDCLDKAEELKAFAETLSIGGEVSVVAFVNKIAKSRGKDKKDQVYSASLQGIILKLEALHRAAGSSVLANDLKKILELFSGSESVNSKDFLMHLSGLYQKRVGKKNAKKSNDKEKVEGFISSLKEARENQSVFESILKELSQPRVVTKKELEDIAEAYLGFRINYKTKKIIIESLERSYFEDAFLASQQQAADDMGA